MTREDAALLLMDFFEEASEAQTLDEWDRALVEYAKKVAEEDR